MTLPFNITNPGINIGGIPTTAEAAVLTNLTNLSYATGDILYYDGSNLNRLAIGTDGQVLTSTGTIPNWEDSAGGGGSGDVTGPASATNNSVAVYDGTTGKLIKDGGATIANIRDRSTHTGTQTASTISDFQTTVSANTDVAANTTYRGVGHIPLSQKGANNGVAELDAGGKVPSGQLPSFVDDVLEFANLAAFPATGETGKIYVALDTNIVYRWSGTAYVEISASLALGETSSTAYRGDRGKIAYDHSQITDGNPHGTDLADLGVTATAAEVNVLDGITATTAELNYTDGVTSAIQTQLDSKAPTASPTLTGTTTTDRLDYDQSVGTVSAIGNLGATETFDWGAGTHFTGTLDANTTLDFSNAAQGQKITLALAYDGTAQRTITWTPTIKWAGGSAPDAPSAAGEELVITVMYLGTTYYASYETFS